MTPLADMIPAMTDADLVSLRANAARLVETGASTQVIAASDILPGEPPGDHDPRLGPERSPRSRRRDG